MTLRFVPLAGSEADTAVVASGGGAQDFSQDPQEVAEAAAQAPEDTAGDGTAEEAEEAEGHGQHLCILIQRCEGLSDWAWRG